MRSRVVAVVVAVLASLLSAAVPATAQPSPTPTRLCLNAHVADIGWQGWVCGDDGAQVQVGTTGQGRRIEAVALTTWGTGGVCAQALPALALPAPQLPVWWPQVCVGEGEMAVVGTTGRSLPIQAIRVGTGTRAVCLNGHVGGDGWLGISCAGPGSTAQSGKLYPWRQMESLIAWIA